MPAYFDQGFFVREPAWHGLGTVLDEFPGREEAMELAGHNFTVVEQPLYVLGEEVDPDSVVDGSITQDDEGDYRRLGGADGWKALVKQMPGDDTDGQLMHIARDSYGIVQNEVAWDIIDALVGEGIKYETGITLKDGAVCSVLGWLDEPIVIPGDDSEIYPWVNVGWSHDGSSSVSSRPTSIRTVCWNTQSAAEAQGKRTGTEFIFRHSKNVMTRIEDAKMAMRGIRDAHEEYAELARELAKLPINNDQRELFVTQFLPMPPEALISDRVERNVEVARAAVRSLFDGPTIPEDHRFTAYGLHLAGGEYLDHLRGYRNEDTRYGRQLLRNEPAKAKLTKLIKDVAKEGAIA